MFLREKAKHIVYELKGHAPFTLFGALLGIVFMVVFARAGESTGRILFSIFHPGHVFLSALVTASMFSLHQNRKKILLIIVVGYLGSIGVATVSDIIIPHLGTSLLGLNVPTHSQMHQHDHADGEHTESCVHEEELAGKLPIHLGFIEEWYIVNPAAISGIIFAFFLPRTKFPHSLHVLISTWASSAYLLMSIQTQISMAAALGIFATLFLAVWAPCCISDIVFPLLFVKSDIEIKGSCPFHSHHSHEHHKKAE